MPFSSDGDTIDFIYGVINWKDVGPASEATAPLRAVLPPIVAEREDEQEILDMLAAEERADAERDAQRASRPMASTAGRRRSSRRRCRRRRRCRPIALDDDAGLADRLCAARESAEVCKAADGRSRAALYRALAHGL